MRTVVCYNGRDKGGGSRFRETDQPLADFQIGLPSLWVTPDNSDNLDQPLAPEGTLAPTWKERGPTWSSVFQTLEGGLGYWAGNHFRYGPSKFSLNATPQCFDRDYMAPPTRGTLATLDPALLVTPPQGLEVGYVPIVTCQASR